PPLRHETCKAGTGTASGPKGSPGAGPSAHQLRGRHDVTATLETSGHEPVHLLSGGHPGLIRRRRARAAAGALPPDQGTVALRRLPLWDAPARSARAGPTRHRPAPAAARFAAEDD